MEKEWKSPIRRSNLNKIDNSRTYYKGKLGVLKSHRSSEGAMVVTKRKNLAVYDYKNGKMTFANPELLKSDEVDELRIYLRTIMKEDCYVTRTDIVTIFNRLFQNDDEEAYQNLIADIAELDKEIIFTVAKDNNETFYGEEYHSNIHFPILSLNNIETFYRLLTTYSDDGKMVYYEAAADFKFDIAMMNSFDTVIATSTKALPDEVGSYANLFNGFRGAKRQTMFLQEIAALAKGNKPKYGIHYTELADWEASSEKSSSDVKTV